jgi:hypothetical protein
MSKTTFVPNELAALYLEEWSWVECGVDDTELEAIACNIHSRYRSTTSLIRIDLSDNQIQSKSAKSHPIFSTVAPDTSFWMEIPSFVRFQSEKTSRGWHRPRMYQRSPIPTFLGLIITRTNTTTITTFVHREPGFK